jgi:hypothetical protein
MLHKAAGFILLVFVAAWIARDPSAAGASVHHWVHSALAFMQHAS